MTDRLFEKLWKDALAQPQKELYIAEYGYPDWFDEIGGDVTEIVQVLENIYDVARMSVREIIAHTGLTQAGFSAKFCIPLRTIENWATEKRDCPDYVRLMMCRELGILRL